VRSVTRYVTSSITAGVMLTIACFAGSNTSFQAQDASTYPHQASDQVVVGAKSFDTTDLTDSAFGKKNALLAHGVLPVLVVIANKRSKAIDVSHIEINLVASDGRHAKSVDPDDLQFLVSTSRPGGGQVPLPVPLPKKKNPLRSPEISSRAFSAKIVPPGDSASGFFYFEAHPEPGDSLYLNGIKESGTGHELIYFEFPLGENKPESKN
jgi:hypothetical protein